MQSQKNNPSEILIHNVVDKDFLELFKPLYILSVIFCLRKFDIYDNFVTPITKRDFVSCVVAMVLIYAVLIFTLRYFATIFEIPTVYAMYFIAYLQYAFNYTILSTLNIFEAKVNVDIILNLFDINKSLRNSNDSRNVKFVVWIGTFILLITYIGLVLLKLLLDPLWNWSRVIFVSMTLIFDLELIYIVFITYFLAVKTNTWRRTLKEKRRDAEEKKDNVKDEKGLREMFLSYKMILNALELTNKVSRFVILFHFVIAFTQSMTYIEIQILWSKNNTVESVVISSHMFGVILWLTKSLMTETAMCVSCEFLYTRISAAQVEVILYFASCPNYVVRRFKKNIFRLSDTHLEKLSPWGIFSVDAGLPLRMGAFVANYIIVLLQFAFL